MWVQSLGQEDPLDKEMATHPSILAWRIPWMEEPWGLQSTVLFLKKSWAEASQTGTIFELLLVQLFSRVGLFGTI